MYINKIKLLKTLTILFLTTSGIVFIPYIIGYFIQSLNTIPDVCVEAWAIGVVILTALCFLTFLGYIIYSSLLD